ncbi:recombinase family protein [Anaeromyxobacter terrae]|uniref:recombinase family protein n=1 Tax=Anaeromyxobacter terrae TaxID=2925406 RepID=UPI001F5AA361|nr:recombinase family protein [Anaeromyxobacter sp. SG22]
MTTPPPRFVELVRVSSAGQAERDTPEDQRRALDRLATTRPGQLVERIEHGASGLSGAADLAHRPDLQRLMDLSAARAYDELRVRSIDRLTRHDDPRVRAAIIGMVRDAGAIIVEAGGQVIDPRSDTGDLVWSVQTWASALERRKIVERTVAARHRLSAQGRPMTTIPYGRTYDYASGRWGVDKEQLAVYRRLFAEALAGVSLHQLAEKLNGEGIPSPKGGRWEASSVRRMIKNPSAIGRMTSYGHAITCPAIVDELTQRRAVEAMKRGRTRSGPPAKHEALLRKLATCASCGSSMHVATGGSHGRTVLYYRCAKAKRPEAEEGCRTHHPVAKVDAAVIESLRAMLEEPERLTRALAKREGPKSNAAQDVDAAAKELEALDAREEKLVRLLTTGKVSDAVYERQHAEVARARAAAQERLEAGKQRALAAAQAEELRGDVEAAVKALRRRVKRATFEEWRALVEQLFPRGPGTWIRLRDNGTIDTNGLLKLGGEPGRRTSASPCP